MRYFLLLSLLFLVSCGTGSNITPTEYSKLQVQATLFPLYDFARTIGGDKAEVHLLLPPGAEPHSYEPTPKTVVTIKESGLFIYTGDSMEPWVGSLAQGGKSHIVKASQHILTDTHNECQHEEHDSHSEHQEEKETHNDPHIWTSPVLAQKLVDNILKGFIVSDSSNANYYTQRATALKQSLSNLDSTIRTTLKNQSGKTLYTGGHFAFRYFTEEYGLTYKSAFKGTAPSAEPSPKEMIHLIKSIEKEGVEYIFFEELINPKVARTIAKETGTELLLLHGAHNVSKEELASGITYIDIMEQNLKNISQALGIQ